MTENNNTLCSSCLLNTSHTVDVSLLSTCSTGSSMPFLPLLLLPVSTRFHVLGAQ